MSWLRPALLSFCVSSLVLLVGCAPGGGEDFELGTGTWRFEALEDGQSVPLVRGAQGGWHVWVSVRVAESYDFERGRMQLTVQPADESGEPYEIDTELFFDPPNRAGYRNALGWPGIVADPACAVGELVRLQATLTLPDGTTFEDERMVLAGPGNDPPPACDSPR